MVVLVSARAEAQQGPRAGSAAGSAAAPAAALDRGDPFAVLREDGRSWSYEMTSGASLSALVVPPQSHRWRCEVKPWTAPGAAERTSLVCGGDGAAPDGPEPGAAWTFWLVFDQVGVRQLDEPGTDAGDRSKTLGFTFPRTLRGTWKLDDKAPDGARARVTVREQTATVRGVARKVWVAEAERWAPAADGKVATPERQVVQFLPGLGPVLMCTRPGKPGSEYRCLRLAADPPPPPERKPAPPPGRVAIASKRAHDPSTLKAGDVATRISSSYLGGVRRCYLAVLANRPAARGALTLDFTVNAVGKTTAIAVKGFDDKIADCVARQVADWRFPIPQSTYAEPRNAGFTVGLTLAP